MPGMLAHGRLTAIFVRNVAGLGFFFLRRPLETTNPKNLKPATFRTKIALSCQVYLLTAIRVFGRTGGP